MKVSVVYVHPIKMSDGYDPSVESVSGTYDDCARRFVKTYRDYPALHDHQLIVVFTGAWPSQGQIEIYENLAIRPMLYTGNGWCSGAHQHAAFHMTSEMAFFSTNRTYFVREGWLRRLMESRIKHGYGFYGTMSSFDRQPHLRTNFYGLDPAYFRTCQHRFDSREDTWRLEHGEWNISKFHADNFPASKLVTWDGEYSISDWRKPDGIFRRGDQSNLLVRDRHTEIFDKSNEHDRDHLSRVSDGL
jgi:hypothetical protein